MGVMRDSQDEGAYEVSRLFSASGITVLTDLERVLIIYGVSERFLPDAQGLVQILKHAN